MTIYGPNRILVRMSARPYLRERAALYALFFAFLAALSTLVVVLPYENVYVRHRAYLHTFLAAVILCLIVFFLGFLYNVLVWMHGKGLARSPEGRLLKLVPKALKFLLSRRLPRLIAVFVKDALYLRKLKERSRTRWLVHMLTLGGFVLMLVLDLVATICLELLRYGPMIAEGGWAKLWLRDFGFDLAGAMMLVGLSLAAMRRFVLRPKMLRTELPDAASILFLLAVVLGGFILEGIGIAGAIEGHELGKEYSFMGYAFSVLMPASWGGYYDEVWLVHGLMAALLVAYIPFSKLFHMIATPVAIELEEALKAEVGMR